MSTKDSSWLFRQMPLQAVSARPMRRSLKDLFFPIQYLEIGAAIARHNGDDEDAYYRQFDISRADLLIPGKRISAMLMQAALSRFIGTCPLGVAPSLQVMKYFPLTANGLLGMLMMTHRTFGDALDAGLLYYPSYVPVFNIARQEIGDKTHLVIEHLYEWGPIREFLLEVTAMTVFKLIPFLEHRPAPIHVYFEHGAVGDPEYYGAAFDAVFHFGATRTKMVLAREDLNIPLLTYSPTSAEQFRRVLEQQDRDNGNTQPVTRHARRLLRRAVEQGKSLSAEQLAEKMCLSSRTLSRRLHDEGVTLPALTIGIRIEFAQVLLLDSRKSIAEISRRAGFGNAASFSRAFKRATGKTPREYRG